MGGRSRHAVGLGALAKLVWTVLWNHAIDWNNWTLSQSWPVGKWEDCPNSIFVLGKNVCFTSYRATSIFSNSFPWKAAVKPLFLKSPFCRNRQSSVFMRKVIFLQSFDSLKQRAKMKSDLKTPPWLSCLSFTKLLSCIYILFPYNVIRVKYKKSVFSIHHILPKAYALSEADFCSSRKLESSTVTAYGFCSNWRENLVAKEDLAVCRICLASLRWKSCTSHRRTSVPYSSTLEISF